MRDNIATHCARLIPLSGSKKAASTRRAVRIASSRHRPPKGNRGTSPTQQHRRRIVPKKLLISPRKTRSRCRGKAALSTGGITIPNVDFSNLSPRTPHSEGE
jgi:hypothetical protein